MEKRRAYTIRFSETTLKKVDRVISFLTKKIGFKINKNDFLARAADRYVEDIEEKKIFFNARKHPGIEMNEFLEDIKKMVQARVKSRIHK